MIALLQNRILQKAVATLLYYAHFGVFFLAIFAYYQFYWLQYEQVAPDQPINFPHDIHAGKLGLDCTFCHSEVKKVRYPNIPKASVCMNCHVSVKTDSPEIIKLTKYYNDKKEIPWVQVHKLKDHVIFSHKRHIAAGVECAQCHGNIQNMAKVRRERTLKMGWCMSCHQSKGASIECWACHK